MPYFQLIDPIDNSVSEVKFMDFEVANLLNKNRTDNKKWIRGLALQSQNNSVGSLTRVLRELGTENFNQYSVQTINRWLEREKNKKIKAQNEFKKVRDLFAEFMSQQSPKNRKLVGKFISLQAGNTFKAGLRLGLAGRLTVDELDDDELDINLD